jgi:hypothetical protein
MANTRLTPRFCSATLIVLLSLLPAQAKDLPTAPKWQRYELTLKSSVAYTNDFQQAEVRALFVSPRGQTNRVYGFWDGGRTWRVRFQPDFPGRWKYYTMCSDPENTGLHEQSGEFLCTAAGRVSRFDQHGPIQVARTEQHLEHENRTPFLWLGDVAWDAATQSSVGEWNTYLTTRSNQNFNVVQWRLPLPSFSGSNEAYDASDNVSPNLNLFRRLDAKIVAANRAGLLNAIAPIWEIGVDSEIQLPEEQAIKLFRYAVARWGADHVVWIIAFETDSTGAAAARWQRIGRAVFQPVTHAPVAVLPGDSLWALDAFRLERWVSILGIQTSQAADEDSLPWLLHGPLASERAKIPLRPVIGMAPPAEVAENPARGQITGELARRLVWWNLLLNTPAGLSYQADAVASWETGTKSRKTAPPWKAALEFPGAQAIATAATTLANLEFWKFATLNLPQNSETNLRQPQNHIAAVATESPDVTLIYTPTPTELSLGDAAFTSAMRAEWINPRTGERSPARPSAPDKSRFTSPSPDDWLLRLQPSR